MVGKYKMADSNRFGLQWLTQPGNLNTSLLQILKAICEGYELKTVTDILRTLSAFPHVLIAACMAQGIKINQNCIIAT